MDGSAATARTVSARPGRAVPGGLLALTAVVVVALVVAAVLLVPWTAAPAGPVDASAGLDPAAVADAERLVTRLRVPSLLALAATTLAAVGLVASGPGRRALARARSRVPGTALQVAVTALLVCVGVELVRLPFAVWSEQVRLAEGLSVRPAAVFARDLAQGWLLETVPTVLAVVVVVLLARRLPRWWPAVAAAAGAVFVVVASLVWPVVVEGRFASFTELPDGPLRVDVERLASEAGAPVSDVLVSDASTRTTTLNAYVSGLGPTRRLVLQDTLVDGFGQDDVRAVVAHEVSHAASEDLVRGTTLGALGVAAGVLVLGTGAVAWSSRRGTSVGSPAAAGAVVLVVLLAPVVAGPAEALVSRQVERAADAGAVALTGDPGAYADMIRTLTLANRSDPSPPGVLQWWFGSHPTPAERVATAEALAG
ncbi:M48 family metalloprotease [Aquipuribacter sp. SD81]|uniref:M48 family metalloprotease n=1 Tax=Aquipuribacter sp. SD81 TaxID=3127703 RepID=UPI00301870F5